MATSTASTRDVEKLGENHFVLEVPDLAVGAFGECTGLSAEREVMEYGEGGLNTFAHKLPGRVRYPNLVLKRGVTDQDALFQWFWESQSEAKLRTVTVKLVAPSGAIQRTWAFAHACPVKWTGPNLNAGSDSAATEQLEIAHQGLVPVGGAGGPLDDVPSASFQRARLKLEGGPEIECLFNPKDYTISKANNWSTKATPGASHPEPQFGGGQPRELSLELLFDVSLLPSRRLRTATDALLDMMEATKGDGAGTGGKRNSRRPPKVTFSWGSAPTFLAVARTLSIQYLLFDPNGEPLRATVKLTLVQAEPEAPKGTNPTTRALGGLTTHVVREGDSLESIAFQVYGDATRWRPIAEANGVDDPQRLRRGTGLAIPRLDG